MNHLAALLLKDICFLRYKLLYVMIIPTLLTLGVAFYNPVMLGVPCITIIILCVIPMSLQSLLIIESRDRKAKDYLLALPYSRKTIVAARYLFLMAEGLLCIGIYLLLLLFTGNWSVFSISDMILTAGITGLMISIIMPLSYLIKSELFQRLLFFIPVYLSFVVSGITEHFPHIWDSFAAGFSISIVMIVACSFCLILYLSAKISEKLLRVRE